MAVEHPARITWSARHANVGLLTGAETIDPAWFSDATPKVDEGWSLVCQFETPPHIQGNPSVGRVRFLVPDAPHERLRVGTVLHLFERATGDLATVEILA